MHRMTWQATYIRPNTRHVIQRIFIPRYLTFMASYNVATNICQTLGDGGGKGGGSEGGGGGSGGRG